MLHRLLEIIGTLPKLEIEEIDVRIPPLLSLVKNCKMSNVFVNLDAMAKDLQRND